MGTNPSRPRSALCAVLLALAVCLFGAGLPASTRAQTGPRNIIVLIGDGMGFEQVAAAGMYQKGSPGTLAFEQLPYSGDMTTYSATSSITDSAAAASAMGTGFKVNNGVISMAYPGDGSELETSLEFFQDRRKSSGLVTSVYVTHATPAGWGAHEPSRSNYSQIAQDYLQQTRPNVIFGGGGNGLSELDAAAAGYTVVTDRAEMQALDTESATLVSGQFTGGALDYEWDYFNESGNTFFDTYPHLSEMTQTALDILDNDPDGFFLMVEAGLIDWAGHSNNLERNVFETIEFDNVFQVVWNWAQGRHDTLIIVTADHETGGLTILQNNGQGNFPTASWSTGSHTATNVPVYAWGPNADMVAGTIDNTGIYDISVANAGSPAAVELAAFRAGAQGEGVWVTWETATEVDLLGFNLHRSESVGGSKTQLNIEMIPAQKTGQPAGASYQHLDNAVTEGEIYHYWLDLIDSRSGVSDYGPITPSMPIDAEHHLFVPFVEKGP